MLEKEYRKNYLELFIVSLLALYLELFIIRILSCDFRIFTVFRTFPLIACFVGFGLGVADSKISVFKWTPIALVGLLSTLSAILKSPISLSGFPSANNFAWQSLEVQSGVFVRVGEIGLLLIWPFFLCYCIGARIGNLFSKLPTLPAYSADLLGAVAGSLLFSLSAFLRLSPLALIALPLIIIVLLVIIPNLNRPLTYISCLALLAAPFLANSLSGQSFKPLIPALREACDYRHQTLWSPYQRIDLATIYPKGSSKLLGFELGINRVSYQMFLDGDLAGKDISSPIVKKLLEERQIEYAFPFELMPDQRLDDVLVVGAGLGQNVKAAYEHKCKHIDAVEIDPVILDIGRKVNQVYKNPELQLICDDARHYFNSSKKKYDLIIFGLLDSTAVAGQGSSVRLDAYVYTEESIRKATSLLKENGILFLNFAALKPWIKYRLLHTVRQAAGPHSLALMNKDFTVWGAPTLTCICGRPVDKGLLRLSPSWVNAEIPKEEISHPTLTDDWPYLYVEPNVIDFPYLMVVAMVVLFSLVAGRRVLFGQATANYWQLFFLGAGFLLVELAVMARLSLIFGSTWFTTAITINGILFLVWTANWFVTARRKVVEHKQKHIYIFTLLTLILTGMIPVDVLSNLMISVPLVGSVVVILLSLLPLCFASLIFPVAFVKADSAPKALTYNLLGAFFGGLLEYLSFYFGNSGLLFLAAGLYFISFLFFLKSLARRE